MIQDSATAGSPIPKTPVTSTMETSRIELFSDAVIAILITIMVLELKAPHDATLQALRELWPIFLSYILSFLYLGIYWNNHHHMFLLAEKASGTIMWANLHLLFWLSLVPFFTAWMGENDFAKVPTAIYGVPLLGAGIAYWILQTLLIRHQDDHRLRDAIGADWKGKASPPLYVSGIVLSLVWPPLGFATFGFVALMWLIPDRRIERQFTSQQGTS